MRIFTLLRFPNVDPTGWLLMFWFNDVNILMLSYQGVDKYRQKNGDCFSFGWRRGLIRFGAHSKWGRA